MTSPPPNGDSSWAELSDEVELRDTAKFRTDHHIVDTLRPGNEPPPLPDPPRRRKILLVIGLCLSTLDLWILPLVYFYSLTYATTWKRQNVFILITCLFCMMTFTMYTHRCVRLFFKCSSRYGPIGWKRKWRLLEFTNVNFAACSAIFEAFLCIGTAPTNPLVRLCAMPSSVISFYFGTLFLVTAFLTQYRYRLPFNMSSTPKGSLWRPSLVAHIEDSGAIEGRGELAWRSAVMARYEASPLFRQMLLKLSWMWGFGLISVAIASTTLIVVLDDENIAFGVGWGLPYVFATFFALGTVVFVKRSLKEERRTWNSGGTRETKAMTA